MTILKTTAIALLWSAMAPVATSSAEPNPAVEVTSRTAEFSFPVAREGTWRWYRAETSENALEYRWEISVSSGGGDYRFGFSLFKFPGRKEESGGLEALLKAGQASLWKLRPDGGGSLIKEAKVSATAGNGCLIIRVSDPATVRLLFGDRPSEAKALTTMPGSEHRSYAVSIRYHE
jgi:hypothetical protein